MTGKQDIPVADAAPAGEIEAASPDSEPKKPLTPPGMLVEVKNMYQGPKDDDGNRAWVESPPKDLAEPVENDITAQNALLIRNVKCYDGRRNLKIDSIVVQSPLIRKALGIVLDGYHGVQTQIERLTFHAPFQPLVHRYDKFLKVRDQSEGTEREHLDLLYDILKVELKDVLKAREDLLKHGVIDYENVWLIFEPGNVIFTSIIGQPCAAKLVSGSYAVDCQGNKMYVLKTKFVDWDGKKFGWSSFSQRISQFSGTVKISELSSMPIQYSGNEALTRLSLIERGRKWAAYAGYHYRHYKGMARGRDPMDRSKFISFSVDSRIIIDTMGWNRFEPNDAVYVAPLYERMSNEDESDNNNDDDLDESEEDDDEWRDHNDNIYQLTDDENNTASGTPKDKLDDGLLLLASPTIKGYSLRDKKWMILNLDGLRPVTFSDKAFNSLVMDDQQKDLILALSSAQQHHRKSFDDVVQGKGRGMIMLLAGPPGVGKTLTAESVAEVLHTPLYIIGAADLGTYNWEVETNLQNVLEMCARWNAVCLIDEADVFMEARTSNNLERNKLVSIFLRTLEYYEGILFLTTNRADNIDAAFHSRIHLSLSYPELTSTSRRRVWENFIQVANKVNGDHAASSFSEDDLSRLAAFNMNGREIKNALKTAQLLASMKKEPLGFKHVQIVMNVEQRYHGRQTEFRL